MSGPRQGLGRVLLRRDPGRPGRWWHFLLAALLVMLSLPVFAALALIVRLWTGPLDVTDTARRLLAGSAPGLSVGRVRLAWNGWREGPQAPVGLRIDDLTDGTGVGGEDRIGHASVSLDLLDLLHGRAGIVAADASDGTAVLTRNRDGTVRFGPPVRAQARAQASGQASDQAGRGNGHSAAGGLDLHGLNALGIRRSAIILHDAASGRSCRFAIVDLALRPLRRPAATGLAGQLAGSLSCGGATMALRASGREQPGGDIVWRMHAGRVDPAAWAGLDPALAPLAGLHLPVELSAEAALSGGFGRAMLPHRLHLTVGLGAGTIHVGAADSAGLQIREGTLHLRLDLPDGLQGAMRATLSDSTIALAGGTDAPLVQLDGDLSRAGPAIRANLHARIAQVGFAGLQQYWPEALGRGARRWVTDNITAGIARNLAVKLALDSDHGWSGLHLAALSGGLDGSDLTLWWLRPIRPLRGMDGHLVVEGPDSLRIETRHATEEVPGHGSITVGPGTIRITGLSRKIQLGQIDLRLRGALPDVLALLAHPRLKLLSRHPIPFKDPAGAVDGRLNLSLPLIDKVSADDIPVRADATLSGVHLGNVAVGRDLDAANLSLAASNDGLKLRGTGTIDGMPSDLSYGMDFRHGGSAQSTETAHLSTRVTEAVVQREGLDDAHRFTGTALLDLAYDRRRSGAARIALSLDLTDSGLDASFWRKSPGAAAQASAVLGLQNGHLVSIGAVHATGPDLQLDGHAEIGSGRPRAVVVERFTVGRSRGAGRIDLPQAGTRHPLRVALRGDTLDIVPFLGGSSPRSAPRSGNPQPASPQGVPAAAGPPWRADLDFRKVLFTPDRAFSGVAAHAEASGERISSGSLSIDGPTPVTATLSPDGADRRLLLDAQDAGALLSALGVAERIKGGTLHMEGRMQDRPAGTRPNGARMTALATVGPFTVHDAPLAARLARDLSIYGFVTGASQRQIVVTRFEIPFTLEGDMLQLTGARASNAALGATLRGPVDLGQDTLDLRGTIVPSYLFNALPGRLPGVGKMFSPEKGGGLLAATLSITGPIDRPRLRVNPLALLAPGILRRLLFD